MHAHCVFILYRLSEAKNKFTNIEDLQQLTVYVKSQNHTNFKALFQGNMENKLEGKRLIFMTPCKNRWQEVKIALS